MTFENYFFLSYLQFALSQVCQNSQWSTNLLPYQRYTLPLVNSDHKTILTISTTIMTKFRFSSSAVGMTIITIFISVSDITASILTTIITNIQMFRCSTTIFRCSTTKMSKCSTIKVVFRCSTTKMFRSSPSAAWMNTARSCWYRQLWKARHSLKDEKSD